MLRVLFLLLTLPLVTTINAQEITKLICPFEHGMGKASDEPFTWDPADKKVILVSLKDTIIRNSIDAKVLAVMPDEEGTYQIIMFRDEYYFWYTGVKKPLVAKGQNVQAGQAVATYIIGTEVEFRMFKDEDPVDPRELLDCKK
jgi:hypothetical protein